MLMPVLVSGDEGINRSGLSFVKWGFPDGSVVKNPLANAGGTGDLGSTSGSGRSPGGGNGNLLQCSCWDNPIDRGAWQAGPWGHNKSDTAERARSSFVKEVGAALKLNQLWPFSPHSLWNSLFFREGGKPFSNFGPTQVYYYAILNNSLSTELTYCPGAEKAAEASDLGDQHERNIDRNVTCASRETGKL